MVDNRCLEGQMTDGGQHVWFQVKNLKFEIKIKFPKNRAWKSKSLGDALSYIEIQLKKKKKSLSILVCPSLG